MSKYKILSSRWYTPLNATIGIVAIQTGLHDPDVFQWKAYIGSASGYDQGADEQRVASWGMPLSAEEAHGFFPYLDVEQYKKE